VIERIVLLKLKPDFVAEVSAICARTEEALTGLPQVRAITASPAAEERTAGAWDLCIRLRFDSLNDVAAYLPDPAHRLLVDEYLLPRVEKLKAFNFALRSSEAAP
jgi:hypothetical protein